MKLFIFILLGRGACYTKLTTMTNLMIFEESKGLTAFECAQKCLESDYCAGIHLRYNYCVFLKYENGGTWNEADFYHRSKLFIFLTFR